MTNEVTAQIISQAPAPAAARIAPDIPVAIDPGPVVGVARDDLTDTTVADAVRLLGEAGDRGMTGERGATRESVRALHRTPRHVVLVFSGHRVALFDGVGGHLTPAASSSFPMHLPALDDDAPEGGGLRSALAAVDLALGSYLARSPMPVVLAGPQTIVSAFWPASRNLARLAGTVYGGFGDTPTAELARRIRPVLNRYLDSHQYAALALIEDLAGDQRVASGITSVWHAARTRQPQMLVVEDGYRHPAGLSTDADPLTSAPGITASESIGDDLVDGLIETVLARGGSIVLAHDGALPEHDRVALTLR